VQRFLRGVTAAPPGRWHESDSALALRQRLLALPLLKGPYDGYPTSPWTGDRTAPECVSARVEAPTIGPDVRKSLPADPRPPWHPASDCFTVSQILAAEQAPECRLFVEADEDMGTKEKHCRVAQ